MRSIGQPVTRKSRYQTLQKADRTLEVRHRRQGITLSLATIESIKRFLVLLFGFGQLQLTLLVV